VVHIKKINLSRLTDIIFDKNTSNGIKDRQVMVYCYSLRYINH